MFSPNHVSHVIWHVSHAMCHVSCDMCDLHLFSFNFGQRYGASQWWVCYQWDYLIQLLQFNFNFKDNFYYIFAPASILVISKAMLGTCQLSWVLMKIRGVTGLPVSQRCHYIGGIIAVISPSLLLQWVVRLTVTSLAFYLSSINPRIQEILLCCHRPNLIWF